MALRDTTEESMVAAHKAGAAYWRNNRPVTATREGACIGRPHLWLEGEDNVAWLAGYYGAQARTK